MLYYFNITGPCRPDMHYMLPPEARLPTLDQLIEERLYFVVHAARQTGKTTAMRAFAARLRESGRVALAWGHERFVVELKRVPPAYRTLREVRREGIDQGSASVLSSTRTSILPKRVHKPLGWSP